MTRKNRQKHRQFDRQFAPRSYAARRPPTAQTLLAERAGLSVRTVGDLERGVSHAPRKDTVALLAQALDLGAPERAALAEAGRRLSTAVSPRPTPDVPSSGVLDTGGWGHSTNAQVLNSGAAAVGSDPMLARLPPFPAFWTTARRFAPAFVPFAPPPYLRPFDSRNAVHRSQSAGARNVVATICAPRAELELVVFPDAGVNLNLQRNARAWFALARHWSDRHLGPCPQGCH